MKSGYMIRLGVWAVSLVILLAANGTTQAALMAYEFSGVIQSVVDDDNQLAGTISLGDPFSGRYIFETTTPDSDPDVNHGWYVSSAASLTVLVGQATLPAPGPSCSIIVDNPPSGPDELHLYGVRFSSEIGPISEMDVIFHGGMPTLFDTDALPVGPLILSSFAGGWLQVFGSTEVAWYKFSGTITELAVVPEPSTALVSLAATVGLLIRRRVL